MTRGDADPELRQHVPFRVDVNSLAVSRGIDYIGRTETGEHLRARRSFGAGLAEITAVDVGSRLAGNDLVALTAVFHARGHVDRTGQSQIEASRKVYVGGQLTIAQRAGVERRLVRGRRRTQRYIQRVSDVEVHLIAAVAGAGVIEPGAHLPPRASGQGLIFDAR